MYDSQSYQAQLTDKIQRLETEFSEFEPPALEVYASEDKHYRMRAEFRVWHEGEDLFYIMFEKQTRERIRVDQFPAASALINKMMPELIDAVKDNAVLRTKLFQVDFLSTLSGELLISLLYHKPIDDEWVHQAKLMRQQFIDAGYKVNIIGRARKIKHVIEKDFVIETLNADGQELTYQQVENSFTQPNGKVAEKMLEWAIDCTKQSDGDLLELYCGNGNFSLALAKNFRRVLATELAKPSVDSAQFNIKANAIDNVKIVRMSAEDFTQAMNGEREFRRLKQADVNLSDYECNTIFVDPPRSGMDDETCKMVQGYSKIMYISCNPDTLKVNLERLSKTHTITRFALFDQFPYTHHVEAGVFLERK
jgi:tRNA (uracil-5-)-methyltransferase